MTQERLTDLAILSIEKTTFESISFDDISLTNLLNERNAKSTCRLGVVNTVNC